MPFFFYNFSFLLLYPTIEPQTLILSFVINFLWKKKKQNKDGANGVEILNFLSYISRCIIGVCVCVCVCLCVMLNLSI